MEHTVHQNDLRALRRSNRTLGLALVAMSVALLFALITILSIAGSEKTIVIPPNVEKTFWVSKDHVSAEYLEQMAAFMSYLNLDVSPANIDWKRKLLLSYVAPDDYHEMKTRTELEADRLRQNNATTAFDIKQLVVNEKQQSVVLVGLMRRLINGLNVGDPEQRSYQVQFKYLSGRVHLKAFKEIPIGQNGQKPAAGTADAAPAAQ